MVPGRRRHRAATGSPRSATSRGPRRSAASTPAAWSSRPASSTCSASPSTTCSSTTARRQQDHAGHHDRDHGRGQSIAPLNARMIAEGEGRLGALRRHARLDDARRLLAGVRARAARDQPRHVRRRRRRARPRHRQGRARRDRPTSSPRWKPRSPGRWSDGAFGVSTSLAVRARTGSPRPRRSSRSRRWPPRYGGTYITHQRDEGDANRREPRRGVPDRARGADPGPDLSPEDRGQAELGPHAGSPRADRGGAGRGSRRLRGQYPWAAGSNSLDASLPLWVREGGREKLLERLRGPGGARPRCAPSSPWRTRTGATSRDREILITTVLNPELKKYEGQTIAEIARAEEKDPLDVAHGSRDRGPRERSAGSCSR